MARRGIPFLGPLRAPAPSAQPHLVRSLAAAAARGASGEFVYLELSPSWEYQEGTPSHWEAIAPGAPSNECPRLVYTFMEDGVKCVEVSAGALKAGYGSE